MDFLQQLFFKTLLSLSLVLCLAHISMAQQRTQMTAAELEDWKRVNTYYYQDLHHAGVVFTAVGGSLLGTGLAATVAGSFMLKNDGNLTAAIPMILLGPAAAITGIVLTPIGIVKLVRAKVIKQKADKFGVDLSYAPIISPATNIYGVNLVMRF